MARYMRLYRIPVILFTIFVFLLILILLAHDALRFETQQMSGLDNKVNLRKMLIAAIQAAEHGGVEIVEVANSQKLEERTKGKTAEGVNDPVTAADGRSHCMMKNGLKRVFPRVQIFSEEDTEQCNSSRPFDLDPTVIGENIEIPDVLVNAEDVTVWIDPLDATKEFTEGLYHYVTTMVCIAVKGKPVIGVIHYPFIKKTAWNFLETAASNYLRSIYVKTKIFPKIPVFTISRSHAGTVKDFISEKFGKQYELLVAAGAGYKVLQVIANNASAYLHKTAIKKWDICAGDAILRHFGGAMTTLSNEPIDYGPTTSPLNINGLLAALAYHQNYISKLIS